MTEREVFVTIENKKTIVKVFELWNHIEDLFKFIIMWICLKLNLIHHPIKHIFAGKWIAKMDIWIFQPPTHSIKYFIQFIRIYITLSFPSFHVRIGHFLSKLQLISMNWIFRNITLSHLLNVTLLSLLNWIFIQISSKHRQTKTVVF